MDSDVKPAVTTYSCSACNRAVLVDPDRDPIKGCKCDAPIFAHCSAVVQTFTGAAVK